MYVLYYSPGAASMAVHWMLLELGVPFEARLVNLETKAQKEPDYLRLNPSGMVPTLVVDGVPRTECAALLLLLAERHPQAGLEIARGAPERAEYLQWMLYFANTLQPRFRAWFYPHEPAGAGHEAEVKAATQPRIEEAWERLDRRLRETGGFVAGPKLSAADFLATMLMRWSRNMPKPANRWEANAAYLERMSALPSFKTLHEREGLEAWPRAG
jgi:glutathione S-transferase